MGEVAKKDHRVPPDFQPLPDFEAPKQETPELLPPASVFSAAKHDEAMSLWHTGGGYVRPSDNFQGWMRTSAALEAPDADLREIEELSGPHIDNELAYQGQTAKLLGKAALYFGGTAGFAGIAARGAAVARAAKKKIIQSPGAITGFGGMLGLEIATDLKLHDHLMGPWDQIREERTDQLLQEKNAHLPPHDRDPNAVVPQFLQQSKAEYFYDTDPNLRNRPPGQEWWNKGDMLAGAASRQQEAARQMGFTGDLSNNAAYHREMYGEDSDLWLTWNEDNPLSMLPSGVQRQRQEAEALRKIGIDGLGPPTKAYDRNMFQVNQFLKAIGQADPGDPYHAEQNQLISTYTYNNFFKSTFGRYPSHPKHYNIPFNRMIETMNDREMQNRERDFDQFIYAHTDPQQLANLMPGNMMPKRATSSEGTTETAQASGATSASRFRSFRRQTEEARQQSSADYTAQYQNPPENILSRR